MLESDNIAWWTNTDIVTLTPEEYKATMIKGLQKMYDEATKGNDKPYYSMEI